MPDPPPAGAVDTAAPRGDAADDASTGAVRDDLTGLAGRLAAAEDDLFATIPILGEPTGQHALDTWVDQCVDHARALLDAVTELRIRRGRR